MEGILDFGLMQLAKDILYFRNVKLKRSINKLKNDNIELRSINNYLNLKQTKIISQLKNEQGILKYFIQQLVNKHIFE